MVPASRSARTRPARQGADVGAAVAADLGLVAHAAERHAHELPAGGAGDRLADRGLAGSGRPDEREDDAGAVRVREPALRAELPHGQVLGDAALHVVEALVVGVEHRARVRRVEPLLGALAPRAPTAASRGTCGWWTPRRSGRPCARGAPSSRCACSRTASGIPASSIFARVLLGDRTVRLAQLLADRVHLLAQDVVALLLLRPVLDVVADALADLQLGQALALELQRQRQPLDHVERLQQLPLLREVEVGGVARGVGQRAGRR